MTYVKHLGKKEDFLKLWQACKHTFIYVRIKVDKEQMMISITGQINYDKTSFKMNLKLVTLSKLL
jgi:bacillopeptidase F (M6 metalloprotease family)